MDKLAGFLPDVDPTTPGVITECLNFIPYEAGMMGAPTGITPSDVPALSAACQGAATVVKSDDSRRIFAGTSSAIYELSGGAWVDRSATTYTATGNRWQFAQFGNATLAAQPGDVIQRSTTGAFAAIASAPKAKILFSVGAFVMALNTIDGTYGTNPDRWWCCASSNETDWTPSVSTLATTGQLVSQPGSITAGGRLGDYAVAYKERAIYLGQFVGAPAVWDWQLIPGGDAGCVGQDAWCDIGGAHFIVGADNIWLFDGSRPVPIATNQVRQWFFNASDPTYRRLTQCTFDKQKNTVWVFYASLGSTVIDSALVYHVLTKQWGKADQYIQSVMYYIVPGTAIDGLTSYASTIDGLAPYTFNSQYWLAGGRALSVFNTSNQLQPLVGPCQTSGFTTGDAGDDEVTSLLSKVRIRFAPGYKPSSAQMVGYTKMTEGDYLTRATTATMNDGKFDVLQEGRWHRADFAFTGDVRVIGYGAVLTPMGNA